MTRKIEDCRTRDDYIRYAEERGAQVERNGKSATISTGKGSIRVSDDCRTLPKGERELFRFWMWGLGLAVAVLMFVAWMF